MSTEMDEHMFTMACAEYDVTAEEAEQMTEAEREEMIDLYYRQTAPDPYMEPEAYYGSVQHADDDPYGHHLMFDVL